MMTFLSEDYILNTILGNDTAEFIQCSNWEFSKKKYIGFWEQQNRPMKEGRTPKLLFIVIIKQAVSISVFSLLTDQELQCFCSLHWFYTVTNSNWVALSLQIQSSCKNCLWAFHLIHHTAKDFVCTHCSSGTLSSSVRKNTPARQRFTALHMCSSSECWEHECCWSSYYKPHRHACNVLGLPTYSNQLPGTQTQPLT